VKETFHPTIANATIPDIGQASLIAAEPKNMRKLIAFDDETFDKLKQLARDRMATFQELADEAFADLLKKHGIPIDLRDALRKSARIAAEPTKNGGKPKRSRKSKA
jgi:non-homologous end joining protein Ku